jgi:transposase
MSKKSPSASPAFSVREFFARFPDEQACLDHIMAVRFGGTTMDCPSCGAEGQFHKLRDRRVYACPNCLFQIAPTANTILHDTRTPLVSWFYAMYLFCTTRHGVSGKELQRQLGVTYKTAYRIGMQIRKLTSGTANFNALLSGHVKLDEAYVGGRRSGGKRGRGAPGKTIVMGLVERGGRMAAEIIPNVKKDTLRSVVLDKVEAGATVSTDELYSYGLLTGEAISMAR